MPEPPIPPPDKRQWMAHYWEADHYRVGPQGNRLPPSADDLESRIDELNAEIDRRTDFQERYNLLAERNWRIKQLARELAATKPDEVQAATAHEEDIANVLAKLKRIKAT